MMKVNVTRSVVLGVLVCLADAQAQTNSWTNTVSGVWHETNNWSLVLPPAAAQTVFITNALSKTVTINATTAGAHPGTMTVSNLTVGGVVGATNTLFLNDAGLGTPLRASGTLSITNGAALVITNSVLRADGVSGMDLQGSATLRDGLLFVSNTTFHIGRLGMGEFTMHSGTAQVFQVQIGRQAGGHGTLRLGGGLFDVRGGLHVASVNANSTGVVWMTGGVLRTSGSGSSIGNEGVGQMTISNGTWQTTLGSGLLTVVGSWAGSKGTLRIAGGTASHDFFFIATDVNSQGEVWLTGGDLLVTTETRIGSQGTGQMTVSNGTWRGGAVKVPGGGLGNGTLRIAGGSNIATSMTVAGSFNATGTVWMTGGELVTTNAPGATIGSTGTGRMTVSNGTWRALTVAVGAKRSELTIAGGTNVFGSLRPGFGPVGSTGDVWVTGGQLVVTNSGITVEGSGQGRMTISNGTVLASSSQVGGSTAGARGILVVAGGSLSINSNLTVGMLSRGTYVQSGGTVSAMSFLATSGTNSIVTFHNGTLTSAGTTISNGVVFTAGDGVSPAILNLSAGAHTFTDGLTVNTNATLNACGTINGTVVNHGTITGDCVTAFAAFALEAVGSLGFSGSVTNHGVIAAANGTVLEFFGPVVNNDTIDATAGSVIFHAGVQNNGTVNLDADGDADGDGISNSDEIAAGTDPLDPGSTPFRVTAIATEGNDIRVTWGCVAGKSYTVQTNSAPGTGYADLTGNILATATGTTNHLHTGGGLLTNLFYRVRLAP